MKYPLLIFLNFVISISFAQLEAIFDLKRFDSSKEPYIETYLLIYGNTLTDDNDSL